VLRPSEEQLAIAAITDGVKARFGHGLQRTTASKASATCRRTRGRWRRAAGKGKVLVGAVIPAQNGCRDTRRDTGVVGVGRPLEPRHPPASRHRPSSDTRRVLSIHVTQAAAQRSAWSWLKEASGVSVEHRPRWAGDPRPWRGHGLEEAGTMSAGNRPPSAGRVERVPIDALGKAKHDPRSPAQFAADLEAETDRSLRSDPGRWPWVSSLKLPRKGTGRR
jgi:hypothetical protein